MNTKRNLVAVSAIDQPGSKDNKNIDETSLPAPAVCFHLRQLARDWAGIHDHYDLPIVQPRDREF